MNWSDDPCWVCGEPLGDELPHTFHAEGCPLRDEVGALVLGPEECVEAAGCNEDVHPSCCPTCSP